MKTHRKNFEKKSTSWTMWKTKVAKPPQLGEGGGLSGPWSPQHDFRLGEGRSISLYGHSHLLWCERIPRWMWQTSDEWLDTACLAIYFREALGNLRDIFFLAHHASLGCFAGCDM